MKSFVLFFLLSIFAFSAQAAEVEGSGTDAVVSESESAERKVPMIVKLFQDLLKTL